MQQITLDQCRLQAERRLSAVYPPGEARSMVRIIFEQLKGYTPVEMVIRAGDPVSDFIAGKVDEVVGRLLNHEPIQYIFGQTQFYGITLKVNPDVLIPRPETEQLVDMIVADAGRREDLDVLDICTGSGCIAIALTRTLLFPHVTAVDISPAALAVARENVAATRTGVKLLQADALTMPSPAAPEYDIIVSNPPYIADSERASMDANVLDYEPHLALFVPDADPLRFYHAICRYASSALRPDGRLYFELNPRFAGPLAAAMKADACWEDVTLIPDMQRLTRFLTATRSGL